MFLIDYFSITFNNKNINFDYVINLLNLNQYKEMFVDLGAKRRYEHCFKFGNINISTPFANRSDMGVYVDMTGQGCREYEELFSSLEIKYDWKTLLRKMQQVLNEGVKINVTRLDLAFDDFTGNLKMSKIERKLKNGEFVSKFRKMKEVKFENAFTKNVDLGKTFYIGTNTGKCCCKFYNKLAEMYINHKKDESVIAQLDKMKHWVRFEITFKCEVAMLICNMMLHSQELEKDICEYINSCFRFIDKTNTRDENCPISPFWVKFLKTDGLSKFRAISSNLKGYDSSYLWFKNQLAPTLLALMQTYNKREDFIKDIVLNGAMRQNSTHQLIINNELDGKKYSNLDLWSENNPFNTYDLKIKDDLSLLDYKPFHY